MLKKEITYKDYNGTERTEDFFFNLNQTELSEMDVFTPGGLYNFTERLQKSNDGPEIYKFFKNFLKKSYGEKSLDGRNFVKTDDIWQRFESCPAYDVLIRGFADNPSSIADFMEGVMGDSFTDEQRREFNKQKQELLKGSLNVSN